MAFTKTLAKHDKITIDGTDVSNAFDDFGVEQAHSNEDVSGFSATGNDETLAGSTARAFVGVAFNAEQLGAIVEPLFTNRTACTITWQPDGLIDATRETYTGSCTIMEWSPRSTRPSAGRVPFRAVPVTASGISVGNWT